MWSSSVCDGGQQHKCVTFDGEVETHLIRDPRSFPVGSRLPLGENRAEIARSGDRAELFGDRELAIPQETGQHGRCVDIGDGDERAGVADDVVGEAGVALMRDLDLGAHHVGCARERRDFSSGGDGLIDAGEESAHAIAFPVSDRQGSTDAHPEHRRIDEPKGSPESAANDQTGARVPETHERRWPSASYRRLDHEWNAGERWRRRLSRTHGTPYGYVGDVRDESAAEMQVSVRSQTLCLCKVDQDRRGKPESLATTDCPAGGT